MWLVGTPICKFIFIVCRVNLVEFKEEYLICPITDRLETDLEIEMSPKLLGHVTMKCRSEFCNEVLLFPGSASPSSSRMQIPVDREWVKLGLITCINI